MRRFLLAHRLYSPEHEEDLTQEVHVRCSEGRSRFRGEASFKTWLDRVILHTCLDYLRRHWSLREDREADFEPERFLLLLERAAWEREQDTLHHRILWERVMAALAQLPQEQQDLLLWSHYEGWSCQEIARWLGTTESTVWVKLHQAREACRRADAELNREEGSNTGTAMKRLKKRERKH